MKQIIIIAIIGSLLLGFFYLVTQSVGERLNEADCLKWQEWNKTMDLFEPSPLMREECKLINIEL